jgi:hypothetical protein
MSEMRQETMQKEKSGERTEEALVELLEVPREGEVLFEGQGAAHHGGVADSVAFVTTGGFTTNIITTDRFTTDGFNQRPDVAMVGSYNGWRLQRMNVTSVGF